MVCFLFIKILCQHKVQVLVCQLLSCGHVLTERKSMVVVSSYDYGIVMDTENAAELFLLCLAIPIAGSSHR